jgi:hypothetical protein
VRLPLDCDAEGGDIALAVVAMPIAPMPSSFERDVRPLHGKLVKKRA